MKREGVSTLFIHSYLRALSFYLTLKCFVNFFGVWCKFENILKMPKFGKLCNDSRIVENVYKVLVLKIFVERRCLERCLKIPI